MSLVYLHRQLDGEIQRIIKRGKSVLLLGPRQTGKSTLLKQQINYDRLYNLLNTDIRRQFEQRPELLRQAVIAMKDNLERNPLIVVDEVQKVPALLDEVQYLIDEDIAQFVLTGSSLRKLRQQKQINLLPGRVVKCRMDALSLLEQSIKSIPNLKDLLLYGSLPAIRQLNDVAEREEDLQSYVEIYLEEEIRQEALVRDIGKFSNFLNIAASLAGDAVNISQLSQNLGVSRQTIQGYWQILEDCLVVEAIPALTESKSFRRLSKAKRYLFFDMGVRRLAAGEGLRLPDKMWGRLFEQYVGIELIREMRCKLPRGKIYYWRDHGGPEVDFVIEYQGKYLPIEVKYNEAPRTRDARHLLLFQEEYPCFEQSYIVCRSSQPLALHERVQAIPWQNLPNIWNTAAIPVQQKKPLFPQDLGAI